MNMKLALIAAIGALGAFAAQAYDGTVVWNGVRPGLGTGSGGAFQLTANQQPGGNLLTGYSIPGQILPTPDNGPGQFLAFCLETGEYLSSGTTYYYDVSSSAKFGGVGGADPIDPRTAWLYSKFLDGTLAGVGGFTYGDTGGNLLQNAIWNIEGESNDGSAATLALVQAATDANPSGIGNVRVLNLWTHPTLRTSDYRAQDMLVVVPEPATYIAGGLALLPLLFGLRSRLGKK